MSEEAILFDIDGTLLDSSQVDDELYLEALRDVLGAVRLKPSWSDYEHVTDAGILTEILRDNGVEEPTEVLHAVRENFVERLALWLEANGPLSEIPGAIDFVSSLRSRGRAIGYATGGWGASARLKLGTAGFPLQKMPFASSDDAIARHEIMLCALRRLPGDYRCVTYYGDGEWDMAACKRLGWHFVPVGERLDGLRQYPSLHDEPQ